MAESSRSVCGPGLARPGVRPGIRPRPRSVRTCKCGRCPIHSPRQRPVYLLRRLDLQGENSRYCARARLSACRWAKRPNSTSLVLLGSRVRPNFPKRLQRASWDSLTDIIMPALATCHRVWPHRTISLRRAPLLPRPSRGDRRPNASVPPQLCRQMCPERAKVFQVHSLRLA